jgi:membrane protease YdiL (CAAX protease family)
MAAGSLPRRAALLFAMLFPSLATWLYFVVFAGHPAMRVVFTAGKLAQFAFPLVWIVLVEKRRPRFFAGGTRGLGAGLALGALLAGTILIAYSIAITSGLLAGAPEAIRAKVVDIGASAPLAFLALALFYSLFHSLMEEYYWRGFVFAELKEMIAPGAAVALSSAAFMAHHVILLWLYFRGTWWLIPFLAAGVAVGAVFWACLYRKSESLLGPWLSHILVDAAIMAAGWDMIRAASGP